MLNLIATVLSPRWEVRYFLVLSVFCSVHLKCVAVLWLVSPNGM